MKLTWIVKENHATVRYVILQAILLIVHCVICLQINQSLDSIREFIVSTGINRDVNAIFVRQRRKVFGNRIKKIVFRNCRR